MIDRKLLRHFDWPMLTIVLLIISLGLIVLYSAGYDPDVQALKIEWLAIEFKSTAFVKQIRFITLGLIAMIVGISIPASFLSRIAYFLYAICVGLLVAVLAFGPVINGSQRWIAFGGFNLQPAEPLKLALILSIARYLSKHPPSWGGYKLREILVPLLLIGLPVGLILVQPDLGTAISVASVAGAMTLFVGVNYRALIYMVLLACVAIPVSWFQLHDYQQRRILTLLNPEADPQGSGWHITQSKIAVGSGEFFGKGFLQGSQTQLEFLPERTTDFIFSVLAEEWGFFGTLLVLSLYVALLFRVLRAVPRCRDTFSSLVVFGIGVQIFLHVVVNIGMVIGILPVVGIPLTLFSYGGSSVISVLFALGIVMGMYMKRAVFRAG